MLNGRIIKGIGGFYYVETAKELYSCKARGVFRKDVYKRQALVPVTQIGSRLAMPLILIGLLLPVQYDVVVNIGIALYSLSVLFQLVTLPVEFNASARALQALDATGILYPCLLDTSRCV